jgi:hypothetical protein
VNSKDYELLVREIYQQMLDQDQASNVVVQHNVQMQGRMTSHQIDVYWEFRLVGVTHRVVDDVPGTIGIMVTSSHYQKGAFGVAKAAGIMICSLEEELRAPVSMYPGETAQFSIKGWLKAWDGSHLGMLVDVAQKIPELSELTFKADSEWHQVNDPLPESMKLINVPQPVQFYDQEGRESFTLTSVLGEFYAEMHREGQMTAHKTRRFEHPTFVKLLDPPRTIKEESFSANIVFRPKVTEVVFKASNVAVFILKNLIDGAEHRVVIKNP